MASITLKNIRKVYDSGTVAVDDFNLEIKDKEFVVFVGPSGCGKSTTLRMIAGLEEITGGELYIGDQLVNHMEPKKRNIAMVFQNYALYPHMTVYDNIAFGLRMRKVPRKEIDKKVREAAEILEISKQLKRKPKQLSGGQRQRVAIGRAIVRDPEAFLMDEPLSNLDAKLRSQMRGELITLRRKLDATFVYVTHDQTEAMTLGDRIVVMRAGHIMQVGTPNEVFHRPANKFVAGFIGTPQMNFLDAVLHYADGVSSVEIEGTRLRLPDELCTEGRDGEKVTLGVRPEHLILVNDGGIPATAQVCEMMGSNVGLHLLVGETKAEAVLPAARIGSDMYGMAVRLAPDTEQLHFFDAETEQRITLGAAAAEQTTREEAPCAEI